MKSILKYISESERISLINEYLKDNFNVDGFVIIDISDESIVSNFSEGELIKAVQQLSKLKENNKDKEFWVVATINGGYYDLNDEGNYRVLSSREYNERESDFGINPKFKDYLK